MNIFKKTYIIIYKFIINLLYQICIRTRKIDKNKVIIVLSRGNKLQDNLQFVFFQLQRLYSQKKVRFIKAHNKMSLKLFYEIMKISSAKYVILDDYYLPIYLIKPSNDLKIIQLWHAAGAFKKFGYSTIGTKF